MCSVKKCNIFIAISMFLSIILALAGMVFLGDSSKLFAKADGEGITVSTIVGNASSKYVNSGYRELYGVSSEEIASVSNNGGSRSGYAFENAFDGNDRTFWISQEANSEEFKNEINVAFTNIIKLESILYKSSYYTSGQTRNFSGYPTTLKVYAATGNDNYQLVGTCQSNPSKDFSEQVVFTLSQAVECDRIKLEFAEVSVHKGVFDGAEVAAAMDISFFKSDEGEELLTTVIASGNLTDTAYLNANSVSSDEMKIRANGGGSIANAFDKNLNTFWISESENTELFKNKLTLTFNKTLSINSIVYGLSYYTRNNRRMFSGFPTILKVYATELNNNIKKYVFMGEPQNNWSFAAFNFPETIMCKKLVLEFTSVTTFSEIAGGAPIVASSEILVMKAEDLGMSEALNEINNIFLDYAQYELKEGIDASTISQLREKVKNSSNYENILKPILDRAEAILFGALKKDPYREFSTDTNAKNIIEQLGDLRGYCYNTLKHSSFGTNRQVTGIGGTTGEKITIYVDGEEGDPLPKVALTQIYGAWNSWKAEYNLHLGKNEITFPNFKAGGSYSRAINAGGPIHIINPYTTDEQSSNVKLYIEGGYLYPVFRDGDDEGTFKMILSDYYERLTDPNDTSITIDAFEAVTGNVMLSCTASLAWNSYVRYGSSPQLNIDKWKQYTYGMLSFGGVEFDPSKPYYDKRNEYIKVNIRAVQPYAGMYAFAAGDHVGIIDSATFGAMVQKWTTGWAFAHEIGHMLDNMNMKMPETTNNMWAINEIYMQNGAFNDRINVTNVSINLASDFGSKVGAYWGNGNNNCDFWWIIEGGHRGYWAKLQQLYCFDTVGKTITDSTERLVYYSSLATGEDMSEYFERWGFYFSGSSYNANNRFSRDKASNQLKEKLSAAISEGKITGESKKYWYVNNEQYRQIKLHGNGPATEDWAKCYSENQIVMPIEISKSGNTYSILLPEPKNTIAHLCYEIQGFIDNKWQVLGITYGTNYSDVYSYEEGTTPQYRIVAYDRMFNHTGVSTVSKPSSNVQTDVCRIGEIKYNTLNEAIAAANTNDTIYLLKDFKDGLINVNKKVTILPDPDIFTSEQSVRIIKNAGGHLFNISGAGNNTVIGSTQGAKIILDGNGFSQNGSLLNVGGATVYINNVNFCNNIATGTGGAIFVGYGSNLHLTDVIIDSNKAENGGGIYLNGAANILLKNVEITNNIATSKGGGLYEREFQGTSSFNNNNRSDEYRKSKILIKGNQAVYGGAIYTENTVDLFNAVITENKATQGGAFYVDINNTGRMVGLSTCTIKDNEADLGSAFYMNRGKTVLNGGEYEGNFYKVLGKNPVSVFQFNISMPKLDGAVFEISSISEEGDVYVDVISGIGNLSQDFVDTLNFKNGIGELSNGTILIKRKLVTLTMVHDVGSFEITRPMGSFTLPERFEGLSEENYVENYVIGDKTYHEGDIIDLTQDITILVTTKKYYNITLIYNDNVETIKFKQNLTYYLPMKTPEGEVVFGWDCSDGNYYVYAEGVDITGDMVFTAVIKQRFTVITVIENIESSATYNYGSTITLSAPAKILGKTFSHWEIDGNEYKPGYSLKITNNLRITAVFTTSWKVTKIIDEEEIEKTVATGTIILLDKPSDSLGRQFKYWQVNGIIYYAGSNYTVESDTEIIAIFTKIDNSQKITVTTITNKGNDQEGNVVEPIREEKQYDYGSVITIPAPTVNEGYQFLYWEINGVKYNAGEEIVVTAPFTATAIVSAVSELPTVNRFTVRVIEKNARGKDITTEYLYNENDTILLHKPSAKVSGKVFAYWDVNGVSYEAGDYIEISADTIVKAIYQDDKGVNIAVVIGSVVAVVAISTVVAVTILIRKKKKSK